jgi:hypothetical protein
MSTSLIEGVANGTRAPARPENERALAAHGDAGFAEACQEAEAVRIAADDAALVEDQGVDGADPAR